MRGSLRILAAFVAGSCLSGVGTSSAAERLATDGKVLGPAVSAPTLPLNITVSLGGDTPNATYVFARFGGNQPLQRNNDGYWVPWSGGAQDLIDNKFVRDGDSLTFKIVDEELSGAALPVQFFVAYKVGTTLKYGSLTVVRP
jgi:hypothetical protein